jgi:site-specific recombinase XerC
MFTVISRQAKYDPAKGSTLRRGWHVQLLDNVITQFIRHKRDVRGRSAKTIEAYESSCRLFRNYVATMKGHAYAHHFKREVIEAWIAHLNERGLDPITIINRLAALRELAKFGVRDRVWATDPFLEIESPRRPVRLPKPFTARERDAMMALDLSDLDTALRAVLYYGALRVDEICKLRIRDLEPPTEWPDGSVTHAALVVRGKGNKERKVKIGRTGWAAIERYVLGQPVENRGERSFVFNHDGGEPWHTKMIQRRVAAWGKAAGVTKATPHRWRHTMATNALQVRQNIMAVKEHLGHSSVATTQMYTAVVDAQKDALADALDATVLRHGSGTTPASPPGHEDA